jgi:opacity protein-like surface antigen
MLKLNTLVFALALASASSAFGQVAEFSVGGGVTRMNNNDIGTLSTGGGRSDDVQLTDGWRINFRLTLNNWRFMGHEFGYAYNRTQFRLNTEGQLQQEVGTAIHQGFYNFLVYATPEGTRVRPFVTGGVHFNNTGFPGYSAVQGYGSTKYGYNYGGGLKVKLTDKFLIRFDVRDYSTGKPFDFPLQSGRIRLLEVSSSLAFYL